MEWIYNWVKNIAFYFLFITVILQALPGNAYKKYIKFYTGLLLVVLAAGPLMQILNLDGDFYRRFSLDSMKAEMTGIAGSSGITRGTGAYGGDLQSAQLKAAYAKELEQQIGEIVKMNGLWPVSVQVTFAEDEEGGIAGVSQVSIQASVSAYSSDIFIEEIQLETDPGENEDEIRIKNDIQEVYNISAGNIYISIRG